MKLGDNDILLSTKALNNMKEEFERTKPKLDYNTSMPLIKLTDNKTPLHKFLSATKFKYAVRTEKMKNEINRLFSDTEYYKPEDLIREEHQ